MTPSFDDALTTLKTAQGASLRAAQVELAPTRSTLVQDRAAFKTLADKLAPRFLAALARRDAAAQHDVRHADLEKYVKDLFGSGPIPGLPQAGLNGYDDALRRIDTLTERELDTNPVLIPWLKGRPLALRGNAGFLADVAKRVEQACAELEQKMLDQAGRVAETVPPPPSSEPRQHVPVTGASRAPEDPNSFDPREPATVGPKPPALY